MLRIIIGLALCFSSVACLAQAPHVTLPKPRFEAKSSDPAWLVEVARFHGHLGPSVVAGCPFSNGRPGSGRPRLFRRRD